MQNEPDKDRRIGSDQDGEDPNRRTDLLKERVVPGTHGGGGDPAWKPGNAVGENESNPAEPPAPPEQKPGA